MSRYIRETLRNGVKLCVIPRLGATSVSIIVTIKSGSDYEPARLSGMSHLLEHVCFRGTATYPTQKVIFRILDSTGPHQNAETTNEEIIFYKKCSASFALQAADLLFELVAFPALRPEDIAIEKEIVKEELLEAHEMPGWVCMFCTEEALYGNQPAGRDIGGTLESVSRISLNDMRKYYQTIAVGQNVCVTVVGKVEDRLIETIRENFARIPAGPSPIKGKTRDSFVGPVCRFVRRPGKQMHVSFAVKTFDCFDKRLLPLQVLANALGDMTSSVLFEDLRIERGLVYGVSAAARTFSDRGYLAIDCQFKTRKLEEIVKAVMRHLVKGQSIHGKYIDLSKDNMMCNVDLEFEDSLTAARFFADRERYDLSLILPEQLKTRIASVSHDDVRAVALDIFRPERFLFVAVGPLNSEQRITKVEALAKETFGKT